MDGVREDLDEVLGYSPTALAKLLGMEVQAVRDRIRSGELPAVKFSEHNWFIPRRKLLDVLDERAEREAEERRREHSPVKVTPLHLMSPQARPRQRSK